MRKFRNHGPDILPLIVRIIILKKYPHDVIWQEKIVHQLKYNSDSAQLKNNWSRFGQIFLCVFFLDP